MSSMSNSSVSSEPIRVGERRHALILSGGNAESRLSHARGRAAALLCLSEGARPCMRCAACRKVMADGHPDVIYLSPEGREIVVGQARRLRAQLFIRPHEGRRKIAVVEAQALNVHAQNALLSVLEEPPPYAVFFLLTDAPTSLLPTIRSRCVEERLPPPARGAAASPEAEAVLAALRGGGEWEILCACLAMERMKREEFAAALDTLAEGLLRDMGKAGVLTARRYGAIIDELRRMQGSLDYNAGVGHICGALAALLAEPEGDVNP